MNNLEEKIKIPQARQKELQLLIDAWRKQMESK